MSGYVPTHAAYLDLRGKFFELVDDYLLLCKWVDKMCSKSHTVRKILVTSDFLPALPSSPWLSCLEGAVGIAEYLSETVKRIDGLAESSPAALGEAFFEFFIILEEFGPHTAFQPLWALAKEWGLEVTEEDRAKIRRGRPVGKTRFTPTTLLELLGPCIKARKDNDRPLTAALVAADVDMVLDTMLHHVTLHFGSWDNLIATWEARN